jgi:hypothetical protein
MRLILSSLTKCRMVAVTIDLTELQWTVKGKCQEKSLNDSKIRQCCPCEAGPFYRALSCFRNFQSLIYPILQCTKFHSLAHTTPKFFHILDQIKPPKPVCLNFILALFSHLYTHTHTHTHTYIYMSENWYLPFWVARSTFIIHLPTFLIPVLHVMTSHP